jgi:hypothetical protein
MTRGRTRAAALVAAVIGLLAGGPVEANDVDSSAVLRIGVPTYGAPGASGAEDRAIRRLRQLETLAESKITVDFAFGSDYQVISWLRNDKIDGALLSSLGATLLTRQSLLVRERPDRHTRVKHYVAVASDGDAPHGPHEVVLTMQSWRRSAGAWTRGDPGADFATLVDRLVTRVRDPASAPNTHDVIMMPSHFSTSGFLAPMLAAVRMGSKGLEAESHEPAFYTRLAQHLHFSLGAPMVPQDAADGANDALVVMFAPGGDDPPTAPIGGDWSRYRLDGATLVPLDAPAGPPAAPTLVLSRATAQRLYPAAMDDTMVDLPETVRVLPEVEDIEDAVRALLLPGGARGWRAVAFRLPELVRLIGQDQITSQTARLSLVLPGGGVKAAYQSRIIDHLYGLGDENHRPGPAFLTNHEVIATGDDGPLHVTSVAGNSGGALLGSFVACLAPTDTDPLTEALWEPAGAYLSSGDVFPFIDLMRWLSIFASALIFWLVVTVWRYSSTINLDREKKEKDTFSRSACSVVWCCLLIGAPWAFRFVDGEAGLEHVPAAAGAFYFICLCIALFADNGLGVVYDGGTARVGFHPVHKFVVFTWQRQKRASAALTRSSWILLVLGSACVAVPIGLRVAE